MTEDDYDFKRVGWMDKPWEFTITPDMGGGRFDTNLPGDSNQGHTCGAALKEADGRQGRGARIFEDLVSDITKRHRAPRP